MKRQTDPSGPIARSPAASADLPVLYYVPAPFYSRFSAHAIDRLILYIFILPVFGLLGSTSEPIALRQGYSPVWVLVILSLILVLSYLVLVRRGQTIGKFLTRCKVVRYDGTNASFGVVLFRETVGKLLSSFLVIGYIWCLFDKERRTLHDIMIRTYVIDCSRPAQDYARAADRRMYAHQSNVKR